MDPRKIKVLLADDDASIRTVFETELAESGALAVASVDSGAKALALLEKEEFDVLVLDMNMPGLSGMDVLRKLCSLDIPVEVVVLTAHGTISLAVEAMKLGAYDFLTKPCKLEELETVIGKACEKKKLLQENLLLKTQLRLQSAPAEIIAGSPAMAAVLETVGRVAPTDLPVLITGESGVGKEVIARVLHQSSKRSDGPFVPINCGAIPDTMIESELFGYEKGAFTGAHARKPGLLEIANTGTLFLDEIGDMPLPLQVKLLRVIETSRFFRLGGTREVAVNVRILSATNKDMQAEFAKGTFRQDLFFRIAALTLPIPPLRERKADIPAFVERFLSSNPLFKSKRFTPAALGLLQDYRWPGNVRELQNVVHRAALLSPGDVIDRTDLPADMLEPGGSASDRLDDVEREHVLKVVRQAGGQKGKAAAILGIDPKTLSRKLQAYGVRE